ncbi:MULTISPECIES: Gfo/Idh/MocA family protein [unclassified Legionella]|uniref:Gfo/Idh/MocA family protein n=1 Tax=unclassified Legionella TaxID=2622702 RepID=UPI001055C0D0|nr:Gfo/Idh/MocA family oxidoreductase [Legionella sp. W10-070]MDI9817760.1 Gfo/Idh/MocA family oxidoreductase [Legionella sp. PL877]
MHVLIVGAGPMSCEYAKILKSMQIPFTVVGRGEASAKNFYETTGVTALIGGYENYLKNATTLPSHAIISVGEKRLGEATRAIMHAGIKHVLVEKPGGIDPDDIRQVADTACRLNANVYVGYNRRFYASVQKAQSIINEDGGLLSFNFEFTEWGHVIAELQKEDGVKENWFLANSSHVIDLAFYLGGNPKQLSSYTSGSLSWHPNAAIYAGSGVTESGALFSYQANWQAPGRWGLEFLTSRHRLYLRPIEKLQIQKIGSIAVEEVSLDDSLDHDFKAGLYKQVDSFINNASLLPTIDEQINKLKWYEKIHVFNK